MACFLNNAVVVAITRHLISLVIIMFFLSCKKSVVPSPVPAPSQPAYQVSDLRKASLVAGYNKITPGMTYQELVTILGPPDFENEIDLKNRKYPGPSREIYYYIRSSSSMQTCPTNTHDSFIGVFFWSDWGKVTWAHAANIDGLKDIGGFNPKP